MRNTGTEYSSFERKPVVLPEMAELLPPLSAEQAAALESDILRNGCYTSIIVNEDMVIIDGHNRQKVCEQYNLPYKMTVFAFEDLLEAKQWALDTQKNRRNLDKWELGKIALKLKDGLEARAKEKMSLGGQAYRPSSDDKSPAENTASESELTGNEPAKKEKSTTSQQSRSSEKSQQSDDTASKEALARLPTLPPVNTRKEMADFVGIGERTMGKIMQIDEYAPQVVKDALNKKELSVSQGYAITKKVRALPEHEQEQAAAEAVVYEKAKKGLYEKDEETERQSKIAKTFCKAYEKAALLTPTEENVRIWTEHTRMTLDETRDKIAESRKLAKVFAAVADIIEQKILPADWRNENGDESPGDTG